MQIFRHIFRRRRRAPSFGPIDTRLESYLEDKCYLLPEDFNATALRLGTDSATLRSYFKNVIGEDFRSWRTRLRIEEAKLLLLREPGLHIYRIGYLTGFEKGNFSRQFHLYTGYTPGEWRKKYIPSPGGRGAAGRGRP